jgi:hypothetical protein
MADIEGFQGKYIFETRLCPVEGDSVLPFVCASFLTRAVSESEEQPTGDDDRNEDLLRTAHSSGDAFVTAKQRGVRVGLRAVNPRHVHRTRKLTAAADRGPDFRKRDCSGVA